MRRERNRARIASRLQELRAIIPQWKVRVDEFDGQVCHLRITGVNSVDYWPATSRAWVLESKAKGFKATLAEVCEIACFEGLTT